MDIERSWGVEPRSGKDSLPVTIEESVLSPARMKLLLLCLGLILVCAQQEENNDVAIRNFDISKISGEWYSIFVASDLEEKVEENGSMRIFVELIYALDNSSLYFKFQTKVNGECTEFSAVADKTEEDGVYSVNYDGYNVFRISEFGDSTYIIVYLANFNKDRPYQVLEFYAREPDVSPELKNEFVEIAQKRGIVKENIIDLTKIDRCFQIRGSGVSQA
nr:major allergen Equ c 1 [Equus caballus]